MSSDLSSVDNPSIQFLFVLLYVVGVDDAEDRKKLYFLIQRLQTVSRDKLAVHLYLILTHKVTDIFYSSESLIDWSSIPML